MEKKSRNVIKVGVDETSRRKGHQYITQFVDMDAHRTIFVTQGKKEAFRDLYSISDTESAASYLAFWRDRADDSNLVPFQDFAKTIKKHWDGIIAYFKLGKLNNGLLEDINTKMQLAKRSARCFPNIDNFIHMIYFISGKLKLDYSHDSL
ncbi:MAG: transposase [Bacteroidales bacterium]|nr:transposase [Candidatus Colimorpha onthohippi]